MANELIPPPWRMFLHLENNVDIDSTLYTKLGSSFRHRYPRMLPSDQVVEWNAEQETGRLNVELEDGTELSGNYEIIGSFDGHTFKWANENPMITPSLTGKAQLFRKALSEQELELTNWSDFRCTLRDTSAILALAGDYLKAERTFLAHAQNVVIAMVLSDISLERSVSLKKNKNVIFDPIFKFFRRSVDNHETPGSLFDAINEHINQRVAKVQPKEAMLFEAESSFQKAWHFYLANDYKNALNVLKDLKPKLGQWIQDAEPAGWLYLCEGYCLMAQGKKQDAFEAFHLAERSILIPNYSAVLLGKSRAATDSTEEISNLLYTFIRDPDWFANFATAQEQKRVLNEVNLLEQERNFDSSDPKTCLEQAIIEMYEQELRAHNYSQAAAKHRTEEHILCEEDERANKRINDEYSRLVIKWKTLNRSPKMGSYGSHPEPNPTTCEIGDPIVTETNCVDISVTNRNLHGLETNFRFEMVYSQIPYTSKPLWRISKCWSVWDDEEFLL